MSQSPRLEEVLEAAIGQRLDTFWTAIPAVVSSYDENSQTVTIRISIVSPQIDPKGNKIWFHPYIPNVPVLFPGGSGTSEVSRITFPIKVGDTVLYIVSSLPTSKWQSTNAVTEVDSDDSNLTRNNIASGFAIPTLSVGTPVTTAPTNAMVLHGPVKVGGATGTEPTFMADTFLSRFNTFLFTLKTEINLIAPGVGDTIYNSWVTTGIKTTKTEVK